MRLGIVIDGIGGGGYRMNNNKFLGLAARGHSLDVLPLSVPGTHLLEAFPGSARVFTLTTKIWRRRQLRNLRRLPDSVCVSHLGPRWTDGRIVRFRVAAALKRLRKDFSPLKSKNVARAALSVAQYIRRENPEVILASHPPSVISALLAKRLVGKEALPVICVLHSMGDINSHELTLLLPEATHIVTVSHAMADMVTSQMSIPRQRITPIYNPVFTPELESLASATPAHPWLRKKGLSVILAAGQLHKVKDHSTLLRAFARLAGRPGMRLVILGEGPERASLEALVRELGLEGKVDMPGWEPNPFAFMSRARLFVLSSRSEGLSGVLIQALACGCPVASTDCPTGSREILEDGRWGALAPVGDDAALAKAMEEALEARPDRDALRRRASFFSVERAAEQYEKVLLKGLSLAPGP